MALRLVLPIAGLIGWAAAFMLVYALHGLGCANDWHQVAVGPVSLQRVVQVSVWLACLPPLVAMVVWLRRRRALVGKDPAERLLAGLAEHSAWIGLAATVYTLFPVLATSACR